jgi:hypothetical protein
MNHVVDVFVRKMSPSNLSLYLFCMFFLTSWFPESIHIVSIVQYVYSTCWLRIVVFGVSDVLVEPDLESPIAMVSKLLFGNGSPEDGKLWPKLVGTT